MSDHAGYCACPSLRAAAEISHMIEVGMNLDGYDPMRALLVGRLREMYGCRGPDRHGHCPWSAAVLGGVGLRPRDDVPLLKGNAQGKRTGQYL